MAGQTLDESFAEFPRLFDGERVVFAAHRVEENGLGL